MTNKKESNELQRLQKRIKDANIPSRKKNRFRLLTWNIRNFNSNKKSRAISIFAKIIKNFDVIAIQEVKDDLGGIEKLQKKLGKRYRFLFSDASGNGERLVFCYKTPKIKFTGLAAEIVMAPGQGKNTVEPELEFERTPYMASFRSNDCNFIVVTVHIYYGSGNKKWFRRKEIENIAKFLEKRSSDTDSLDSDYIACGDFNIEQARTEIKKNEKDDPLNGLFDLLQSQGLKIHDDIKKSKSNLSKTKHFDQIAYHKYRDSTITYVKGGIIDFTKIVYRNDPKLKYKLTDHLPMWAVFDTKPDKKPKHINP